MIINWKTLVTVVLCGFGLIAATEANDSEVSLRDFAGEETWISDFRYERFVVRAQRQECVAYTMDMKIRHVASLQERDLPWVSPARSADENMIVGWSRGWAEDPKIEPQPIFGYMITDLAVEGPKLKVVLVGSNHPHEHPACWTLHGMVEFLVSDDPRAEILRRRAIFYVYPVVNPDGKVAVLASRDGPFRNVNGNPELRAAGESNHNRVWDTDGQFTSIDVMKAAWLKDTGGTADYLLDVHGIPKRTLVFASGESATSPFATALTGRTGFRLRSGGDSPDRLRHWATSNGDFRAEYAFTPEMANGTEEEMLRRGKQMALAFHDVVADRGPSPSGMKHVGVYYREGDFAAWPANHGIWSWGNEILVGFQAARHRDSGAHTWDSKTSLHKFARSLDGGLTWTIEDAFEQGITASATGHRLGERADHPVDSPGGIDFQHPDFAFTFRRAKDRAGPSCFYYSYDRGRNWEGPFKFPDLDTAGVATRTDYIVEGKHRMLAFLTTAKSNGEKGRTACARTMDGGKTWERVSWIGPEPEGQAIMPASVGLSPSRILVVLRQTGAGSQSGADEWLSGYLSEDGGLTWERQADPAHGLGWNSNPPALIQLEDGRLCLIYGVRGSPSRLVARFSADEGKTWSEEIVLRGQDGANRDMGYVRAVQRPDGKVVAVYYYNHALSNDRPPYRYIAATIFDPRETKAETMNLIGGPD